MTEHLCEGIIKQSPSRSGRVTTEWGPVMTVLPLRRPFILYRLVTGAASLVLMALAALGPGLPAAASPTTANSSVESMLFDLMEPTIRLSRDDAVRNLVYEMVAEQFDGDTNVLYESFLARAEARGLADPAEPQWQVLRTAVGRFATLTDGTYKPQIYLPNFGSVARSATVSMGVAPMDESVLEVPGFQWITGGGLSEWTMIDEAQMEAQEFWIVSLNERTGMTATEIEASKALAATNATARTPGPVSKAAGAMETMDTPCNPSLQRNNRGWEYLEWVLIENPRDFEGPFQGKLDMRLTVLGANGAKGPVYNFGIGRTNSNWNGIHKLLTTWDTAVYGQFWAYIWFEIDDKGGSTSYSYTIPNGGGTVTWNMTEKDKDMGSNIVQFTDLFNTEYTTGEVTSYVCGVGGDGGTGFTNWARSSIVTADTTFGGYSTAKTIDGSTSTDLGGAHSWANGRNAPLAQKVTYDLGVMRTISQIALYTTASYPMKSFRVLWWDANLGFWRVAAETTTNTAPSVTFNLTTPISTRVVIVECNRGPDHQPGYVRINELELYG